MSSRFHREREKSGKDINTNKIKTEKTTHLSRTCYRHIRPLPYISHISIAPRHWKLPSTIARPQCGVYMRVVYPRHLHLLYCGWCCGIVDLVLWMLDESTTARALSYYLPVGIQCHLNYVKVEVEIWMLWWLSYACGSSITSLPLDIIWFGRGYVSYTGSRTSPSTGLLTMKCVFCWVVNTGCRRCVEVFWTLKCGRFFSASNLCHIVPSNHSHGSICEKCP